MDIYQNCLAITKIFIIFNRENDELYRGICEVCLFFIDQEKYKLRLRPHVPNLKKALKLTCSCVKLFSYYRLNGVKIMKYF